MGGYRRPRWASEISRQVNEIADEIIREFGPPKRMERIVKTRWLLIVQCGAMKHPNPAPMPAQERYIGPLWRTVRRHLRDAQVMVLSAKHGLINGRRLIERYDQRLTDERVEELLACGIHQRQALYQTTCYAERVGTTAYAEADAARMDAGCEMFEEVAIVGGRRYVQVAHSRVGQLQPAGIIAQDAEITIINDEIGRMRQQTKAWLGEVNADRMTKEG